MAKLTAMKAIRKKCLQCTNNQYSEVRNCEIKECALWPYRSGHRPTKGEEPTEEETN